MDVALMALDVLAGDIDKARKHSTSGAGALAILASATASAKNFLLHAKEQIENGDAIQKFQVQRQHIITL